MKAFNETYYEVTEPDGGGNISVVIYDTCQELLDSSSKKKALKEQIKALQAELDKL